MQLLLVCFCNFERIIVFNFKRREGYQSKFLWFVGSHRSLHFQAHSSSLQNNSRRSRCLYIRRFRIHRPRKTSRHVQRDKYDTSILTSFPYKASPCLFTGFC